MTVQQRDDWYSPIAMLWHLFVLAACLQPGIQNEWRT